MNIKKSISIITILLFSFLFCITCTRNIAIAEEECVGEECTVDGEEAVRGSDYYETQVVTDAYGGTLLTGQFGPDVGIGEQGTIYKYTDPRTGTVVSYSTTNMGVGLGGVAAGYGGMYSPYAQGSYGMFAGGNQPTAQATPGLNTQQYQSGNIFGQNTQFSQATPDPYASTALSMMQNPQTAGLGLGLYAQGMYSSPGVASVAGSPFASAFGSIGTGIGYPTSIGGYGIGSYGLGGVGYGGSPYGTVIGGSAYGANPYQTQYNPYQAQQYNPYQTQQYNPYQTQQYYPTQQQQYYPTQQQQYPIYY
jgi:hypothetical protein